MPLNTTTNDPVLPEGTKELPQGTLAEDTLFELHIRARVIVNSMVNFLKGVRDSYIRDHTLFLLCSTLCLMVNVLTAAAYLQENENDGPPIFLSLLYMAANLRRRSEISRRKAYLHALFKGLVGGLNPDYRSKLSVLRQYHYSWFKHH